MVRRIDVRVDVSEAVGLGVHLETAAWIFLPERLPTTPIVLFAFPGASYSRAYFDISVPGRPGYSVAEHLVDDGYVVVTCDYPGLGDSTPYEPLAALSKEAVVDACQATTVEILKRLTHGAVAPDVRPLSELFPIGVGHSLGGYFLTRQQGRYATFDAVAILSWTQFLPPWSTKRAAAYAEDLRTDPDPSQPHLLRARERHYFYGETVPDDVVAADTALAVRLYPWMFPADKWGLQDDATSPDSAERIEVPVFLGFGADDISPDPRREPLAYPRSTDITTFVLPDSGHCFNFAGNRHQFFARLSGWSRSVYAAAPRTQRESGAAPADSGDREDSRTTSSGVNRIF